MSASDLFTATYLAVGLIGLAILGILIVRTMRERTRDEVVRSLRTRPAAAAGAIGLLGIGVLFFLGLAFGPPTEDMGNGPLYLLPATYLAGVAVLAVLHARWAGYLLAVTSVCVVAMQVCLGIAARSIEPAWEGFEPGIILGCYTLALPAALAAVVLLLGDPPAAAHTRWAVFAAVAVPVVPAVLIGLAQGDLLLLAAGIASLAVLGPALLLTIVGRGGSHGGLHARA